MPAKDIFHQLVRTALEHEGWIITHDQKRRSQASPFNGIKKIGGGA